MQGISSYDHKQLIKVFSWCIKEVVVAELGGKEMTDKEKIDDLERRVKELEARPRPVIAYPAPVIYPVYPYLVPYYPYQVYWWSNPV